MNNKLNIGWLYPDLMSTYGDRGNVMILEKRCKWRSFEVEILPIDFKCDEKKLRSCDLIFGGGAQDRQQKIVISDLKNNKGPVIKSMLDSYIPGLFVCGSPQLLGHTYMTGDGEILEGLGIFNMHSKHFGHNKPRCIGNLICSIENYFSTSETESVSTVVGFENHGGRTYLNSGLSPFAKVISGFGNNGQDGTEGAMYKNCIATYSHGPFLSKNPHIADWLIKKALEVKYQRNIKLKKLDDSFEWKAHKNILKRYNLSADTNKVNFGKFNSDLIPKFLR